MENNGRRSYIETFDGGPGGWVAWAGNGLDGAATLDIQDGAVFSSSPWWVDANHAPPGAGYLHILCSLHTGHSVNVSARVREVGGVNAFLGDGFSSDLTHAKITVRIKGEVQLRGAQLLLLAQGNTSEDPARPNWVNQVLTAQPIEVTPEWSVQSVHLVPDQNQWIPLGARHDRVGYYGSDDIARLLRDVNGDILFVLFPLNVRAIDAVSDLHVPFAGEDYEVDQTHLPEGSILIDEVRIDYPQQDD